VGLIRRAHPADHQLIDNELAHPRSPDGEAADRQSTDGHRADG
jgi:hypothetical protein